MPSFHILTFGCKVNQCDTAGLAQELANQGWQWAPRGQAPDLIVVNTCTVTARADQQARQAVRRWAREFPGVPLWVTGCYAQRVPADLARLPGVRLVLGNREKYEVSNFPPDFFSMGEPLIRVVPYTADTPFQTWRLPSVPGHTRAWLKIQEGCQHRCSYCIVPTVRGPRRSLAPSLIEAAFQELAGAGCREVVLTGINLGQYGQDLNPATDLTWLMGRLGSRPWPFRLRLSSLEPQEITLELLRALAAFPGLCHHFHVSLQSGAAPVLAAMHRPSCLEDFQDCVREICRYFPGAALGLDILVGFPTESLEDFQATLNLLDSLSVAYLHVFPYSLRPGTPAAALPLLPAAEVRRRATLVRDLARRKKLAFYRSHLGKIREVLVEGPAPQRGWLKGVSDNFLRVLLPGPLRWRNQCLPVRLREVQGEVVLGEPLEPV